METSNVKAMREALEWFWGERSMLDFCRNNLSDKTWEDWNKVYNFLREFADKVQSALATPPRNCDVGTSEEQYQRFDRFCREFAVRRDNPCKICPCNEAIDCRLTWAQLPYEEGGK